MRILLVSSSSGSCGGGEIFLLYLGEALKNAGHTVALWTSRHIRMDELARRFASIGEVLRHEYLNTYDHWHRGLFATHDAMAEITSQWSSWKPDLIHLNKQNLEDGNDLLAAAAALPIPQLCTIHITQSATFLKARLGRWRDARARQTLRAYPHPLVAVAPKRAEELAHFLGGSSRVQAVSNGVPPATPLQNRETTRQREGLKPASLAVVAVGRLEPQKAPLRFLDYARKIRQVEPSARFHWIGSGRMAAEWDETVRASNLTDAVTRSEWRNDVVAILGAYDLFLHSAEFEGLPLAVLEAMDAGLPCAIEGTVHAQMPPSLQACSLRVDGTTNWRALLDKRTQWRDLAQNGRAAVRREFSTAAMAAAYEKIYGEICAHP